MSQTFTFSLPAVLYCLDIEWHYILSRLFVSIRAGLGGDLPLWGRWHRWHGHRHCLLIGCYWVPQWRLSKRVREFTNCWYDVSGMKTEQWLFLSNVHCNWLKWQFKAESEVWLKRWTLTQESFCFLMTFNNKTWRWENWSCQHSWVHCFLCPVPFINSHGWGLECS